MNMHQLKLQALHIALMKGQYKQNLWIDSTTLTVFKNQWIQRYKSLAAIATHGKSYMGCFFCCKLY
jgi:hypothetical protein